MHGVTNNVSLPKHHYGFLRTEFRNNLKIGTEGLIECVIFGAEAIPGYAIGFHVLAEDGSLYSQVPVHGICATADAPKLNLSDLQAWDCFGFNLSVISYEYLWQLRYEYLIGGEPTAGEYIATFDFYDNGFSDRPEQHKHLHWLVLDNGCFALMPNNRLRVEDKSFTTKLFDWNKPPQIEANTLSWSAE